MSKLLLSDTANMIPKRQIIKKTSDRNEICKATIIVDTLDALIEKARNSTFYDNASDNFKLLISIYQDIIGWDSLYSKLLEIEGCLYKKCAPMTNVIIKDLYDILYTDRNTTLSKYLMLEDVHEYTDNIETVEGTGLLQTKNVTKPVDFKIEYGKVNTIIKDSAGDLALLLRKIGLLETLYAVKILFTKVRIWYANCKG